MIECSICRNNFKNECGLKIHKRGKPHKQKVLEQLNAVKKISENNPRDIATRHDKHAISHEYNLDEKTDNIFPVDMSTAINKDEKMNQCSSMDHIHTSNNKQSNLVKIIREKMTLIPDNWDSNKINSILNFISMAILADHQKEKYPINAREISDQMGYSKFDKCKDAIIKNIDAAQYKIIFPDSRVNSVGRQKEEIVLTVDGFKILCTKSGGPMASQICIMYMDAFAIFQACLLDPTNTIINEIRGELKERLSLNIDLADRKVKEIQIQNEMMDKPAFYIIDLGNSEYGCSFKPGVCSNLIDRASEHRRTFGLGATVIAAFDLSHLNYRQTKMLDKRIKMYFKSLKILNPIEKNTETITFSNPTEIEKVISHIEAMIPAKTSCDVERKMEYDLELARFEDADRQRDLELARFEDADRQRIHTFEMKRLEITHIEDADKKRAHELEMLKLHIEMKRLEITHVEAISHARLDTIIDSGDISDFDSNGYDDDIGIYLKWINENQPKRGEHKSVYYKRMKKANPKFIGGPHVHNEYMNEYGWVDNRSHTGHRIWIKKMIDTCSMPINTNVFFLSPQHPTCKKYMREASSPHW